MNIKQKPQVKNKRVDVVKEKTEEGNKRGINPEGNTWNGRKTVRKKANYGHILYGRNSVSY